MNDLDLVLDDPIELIARFSLLSHKEELQMLKRLFQVRKTLTADGDLDLDEVKALPANARLIASGSIFLGGMTSIPATVKLCAERDVYLDSLTCLPRGFDVSHIKGVIRLQGGRIV